MATYQRVPWERNFKKYEIFCTLLSNHRQLSFILAKMVIISGKFTATATMKNCNA